MWWVDNIYTRYLVFCEISPRNIICPSIRSNDNKYIRIQFLWELTLGHYEMVSSSKCLVDTWNIISIWYFSYFLYDISKHYLSSTKKFNWILESEFDPRVSQKLWMAGRDNVRCPAQCLSSLGYKKRPTINRRQNPQYFLTFPLYLPWTQSSLWVKNYRSRSAAFLLQHPNPCEFISCQLDKSCFGDSHQLLEFATTRQPRLF